MKAFRIQLFDFLVTGHIMPINPAAVRGPKYVIKTGKTTVLTAQETRQLLDAIDTHWFVSLRNLALIAVMVLSLRELAQQRESVILEGHLLIDHVHLLIAIPPKYAVSQVMGYLKGKSTIHLARTYMGRQRNFTSEHFGQEEERPLAKAARILGTVVHRMENPPPSQTGDYP